MFTGFGIPELLIVLVIVILVFGASRVPQVGEQLGAGIRNFKDALTDGGDEEENKKLEDDS